KGVNVSQRSYLASRTFFAASTSCQGVSYSASNPCSGAFSAAAGSFLCSSLMVVFEGSSVADFTVRVRGMAGRVGVGEDARVERLHLRHRDHRQVAAEEEEEREEQPEAAAE